MKTAFYLLSATVLASQAKFHRPTENQIARPIPHAIPMEIFNNEEETFTDSITESLFSWGSITSALSNAAHSAETAVTSTASNVASTVSNAASSAASTVKNAASSAASTVSSAVSSAASTVGTTVTSAVNQAGQAISTATQSAGNDANAVGSQVANAAADVGKEFQTVADDFANGQSLVQAAQDWSQVNWQTGAGIAQAIQATAEGLNTFFEDLNNLTGGHLTPQDLENAAAILGLTIPDGAIAIKAGEIILNLGDNAEDITTYVQGIAQGFQTKNYMEVITDGFELFQIIKSASATDRKSVV